jgi:integrase
VHFLSEDECRRIVNACDGAFRSLVRAALLSGCRYGELTRMRTSDFNAEVGCAFRAIVITDSRRS